MKRLHARRGFALPKLILTSSAEWFVLLEHSGALVTTGVSFAAMLSLAICRRNTRNHGTNEQGSATGPLRSTAELPNDIRHGPDRARKFQPSDDMSCPTSPKPSTLL